MKRPAARLAAMLALCSGKRVCDETGAAQPAYKQEGTRIMAEFPKPKGDDALDQEDMGDPIERKQVRGFCFMCALFACMVQLHAESRFWGLGRVC